jgi:ribosomal protein S24E|tara:strand:- start:410 stop:850 length:441 start_codon:yes stop_codon:yes gene_type:complete
VISVELKEIQKKEEPLLARTKVEYEVVFDKATPSGNELKASLVKKLSKAENLIDIKGIYTDYGTKKAKILCYAYNDEETLKKIKKEGKKAKEKAKKAQEKTESKEEKTEEKPKEEKAAEKPKEEKVEEKKKVKEDKKETKEQEKEK